MGLFKRTRFWWGSYHDHRTGEFVRKSTRCSDKEAARAVLIGWERSAADPEHRPKESTTLRALIAKYRDVKKRAERAAGTQQAIYVHVRHIARILGDLTIVRDITALDVDRYVTTREDEGTKRSTIAKEISTLRGMLKLAHRHGHCDHWAKVMPVDLDSASVPGTRKVATLSDLGKLVDGMDDTMRKAHCLYLAATGCDWGPSLRARRADIDLDRGLVHVPGTKTGSRTRDVPIVALNRAMLEAVVEVAPKTGPMFRRWTNVTRDLALACERAGIARITPRDFRRTLGTWLRKGGVDPSTIGAVLGHADGRMAERVYGKIEGEDLRRVLVERLERDAAVRDTRGRQGSQERQGLTEGLEMQGNTVPGGGIEPSTRGFSIRREGTRKPGKLVRSVRVRLPNGTRLYVKKARSFGELLDAALALGGGS
jgi:integrase